MNLYSATIEIVRRFAARRQQARTIEKRIYVFVLVPFDFRGNGHTKRAEVAQHLIDEQSVEGVRNEIDAELSAINCGRTKGPIGQKAFSVEPQLNYDLMWTWFLPNPLWPPKEPK